MNERPMTACRWPGCTALTTKSPYCERHHQEHAKQWNAGLSSTERGYGRKHQIARDRLIRAHPFCVECEKAGRVVMTTVLDHIVPKAEGGTDDVANLQGLCDEHSKYKTANESARGQLRAVVASQAFQNVLVFGPPCAGKSFVVNQCKRPGDIVLDLDVLWCAISGSEMHSDPGVFWPVLRAMRDAALERVALLGVPCTMWVIAGVPAPEDRNRLIDAGRYVVRLVNPGEAVCMERAASRPRRVETEAAIRDWFDRYLP